MKTTALLVFFSALTFLAAPVLLTAQTALIEKRKAELQGLEGLPEVRKMLELTDAFYDAGLYEKALDWAESAEKRARKIKEVELQAIALNKQGRLLALLNKKTSFRKNKAVGKYRESLEKIREMPRPDANLALDNLQQLRTLAEKAGEPDRMREIDDQIAAVKSQGARAPAAPVKGAERTELVETVSKLEQEKIALRQEIERQLQLQQDAQSAVSQQEEKWTSQSKVLMDKLARQEAAISEMTEAQMKSQLMYLQQRQLLDSLTFRASLDSVQIISAGLAVREAKSRNNFLATAAAALLLLLGGSTYSFIKARKHARELEEKNKVIRQEQQRSEALLLNILPANIASELKVKGFTDARYYARASVLFVDFVGFSKIAARTAPDQLVADLDTAFKAFDEIIGRHGIEKIKTIGDAYMCAAGLTEDNGQGSLSMVEAAREIQLWLKQWNVKREPKRLPRFDARIGIHTGPVVAGVVGAKKFAFDIWGDTVNVAARVEQAGEGGKINISGDLYAQIKDHIPCQYRGSVPVKNMGDIEMYFVSA